MAVINNQAQLSYNGISVLSNITTGEILDALTGEKNPLVNTYIQGDNITYVISLRNSAASALSGLTITDDLGGYTAGTNTVYPLTYIPNSAKVYVNGVLQQGATVNPGPPLTVSGLVIPSGGNAVLIYSTTANEFAPLATGTEIVNSATATAPTIVNPLVLSSTANPRQAAFLTITKSMNPTTITENGRVTYTFVIQNYGNTATAAGSNVSVTDTFTPQLADIAVTLNGTPLAEGTGYTYNPATGAFATQPDVITVDAAQFTTDPATGRVTTTPGTATLAVTGTI